ncbi:MAG TPA: tRNA (adenosine(37)-N6)-dimethylallyltransferase MiaA [Terriglobales bacterium]|nr:tRNA (adenosine(37)-N6)-dimethylallyltransferase MiaA [Terriglobales bacterium]
MIEPSGSRPDPLLVVILGPTGSGKTGLSLRLAEQFNGEIVNCDSVAIYKDIFIGTAKPEPRQLSRAPHHLFDAFALDQYANAGDYARLARQALAGIAARSHLPIVVGGTGLYLRALLLGLFDGPGRSDDLRERLRQRQLQRGPSYLHRLLNRFDPASAATIHANDLPKLIRALEVFLSSRRPMSKLWQSGRNALRGFRILKIGLNPDRTALYSRLNQRAALMFDQGLVEETAALLERYPQAWALSSLGYRQATRLLRGEETREQAISSTQQAHRNYAKRQMTWFRREPEVHWLPGFGDEQEIQNTALSLLAKSISGIAPAPETANLRSKSAN